MYNYLEMCILHILNNIQIKLTLRLTINARKKIDKKYYIIFC